MDTKIITEYLAGFLTGRRKELIDKILSNRSRYITVLMEEVYHSHNISAIIRTCECCGVQDLHVVENKNALDYNPMVLKGSDRWLDIYRYRNNETKAIINALHGLKSKGYRIVATSPHSGSVLPDMFDMESGPFVLVLGNEKTGISDEVSEKADAFIKIPMYGFTESFNVSVTAGILLSYMSYRLRQSDIVWNLSDSEKNRLRLQWYKNSVKDSEGLINRFLSEK